MRGRYETDSHLHHLGSDVARSALNFFQVLGSGSNGLYSLIGKQSNDPLSSITWNFLRAVPMMLLASIPFASQLSIDIPGVLCAIASGTIASGVGYAIWYAALRSLSSFQAATVQLSVPVLASLAGVLILNESLTTRLALTSLAVLGGIGLILSDKRVTSPTK